VVLNAVVFNCAIPYLLAIITELNTTQNIYHYDSCPCFCIDKVNGFPFQILLNSISTKSSISHKIWYSQK